MKKVGSLQKLKTTQQGLNQLNTIEFSMRAKEAKVVLEEAEKTH